MKKIILLLLAVLLGVFFLTKGFFFLKIITVFFALLIGFLTLFVKRIPARECWVIDRWGKLIEKRPGYRIIVPYFGIDKVIKKIPTVQYAIPLFEDLKAEGKEVRIDLKKGGEVILHDPRIWILVKNPLETVRVALDFENQLREMVENRITGALNIADHEDVMQLRQPRMEGMEEQEKQKIKSKLDEYILNSTAIKDFLSEVEIEYKGFTLDDFDFDENTKTQRRERILSEMEKEVRKNRGEAFIEEMKGYPKGVSPDVAAMLLKGQAPVVVKIEGSGGFNLAEAALQWELGKKIAEGKSNKYSPEKKEEKKDFLQEMGPEGRKKYFESIK